MNFSTDELHMIERLRRREAQFSRWRWFWLALCVCMLMVGVGSLFFVYQFAEQKDELKLILVAYGLPPINSFLLVWLLCLGSVISRWRGDSKTRLLLKLTDELQKRGA